MSSGSEYDVPSQLPPSAVNQQARWRSTPTVLVPTTRLSVLPSPTSNTAAGTLSRGDGSLMLTTSTEAHAQSLLPLADTAAASTVGVCMRQVAQLERQDATSSPVPGHDGTQTQRPATVATHAHQQQQQQHAQGFAPYINTFALLSPPAASSWGDVEITGMSSSDSGASSLHGSSLRSRTTARSSAANVAAVTGTGGFTLSANLATASAGVPLALQSLATPQTPLSVPAGSLCTAASSPFPPGPMPGHLHTPLSPAWWAASATTGGSEGSVMPASSMPVGQNAATHADANAVSTTHPVQSPPVKGEGAEARRPPQRTSGTATNSYTSPYTPTALNPGAPFTVTPALPSSEASANATHVPALATSQRLVFVPLEVRASASSCHATAAVHSELPGTTNTVPAPHFAESSTPAGVHAPFAFFPVAPMDSTSSSTTAANTGHFAVPTANHSSHPGTSPVGHLAYVSSLIASPAPELTDLLVPIGASFPIASRSPTASAASRTRISTPVTVASSTQTRVPCTTVPNDEVVWCAICHCTNTPVVDSETSESEASDEDRGHDREESDEANVRATPTPSAFRAIGDGVREGSPMVRLNCHHSFHVNCLQRWLLRETTCPMCRREVVSAPLHSAQ